MFPVLFSIGNVTISSFGVFLALGFLFGVFLVWRLSRAWDLSEEKILDLTLVTFIGGLIFSRLYFGIEHFQFFAENPFKLIFVNKYPGFSFWGGFLGGWLSLYFFCRRFKMDFWQIADIAVVGFLGGLILSDIGCFLGGCGAGIPSKLFFSTAMVGLLGKRFPVQILEAALFSLCLFRIWSKATHFHPRGKIISQSLILIGIIKLAMEPLRAVHGAGYIFSLTLIVLGVTIFYKTYGGSRTPLSDLSSFGLFLVKLLRDKENRQMLMVSLKKSWYNQKTAIAWKLGQVTKLLRRLRVRPSPKNFTDY